MESDKYPLKDLVTVPILSVAAPEFTPVSTNQIVQTIPVLPVLET